MTFTPPTDMSVMVQSRGSELVPNWIFAKLLQSRRSLLRRFSRFACMSIPGPTRPNIVLALRLFLTRNYSNFPSRTARILSTLVVFLLPCYTAPYPGNREDAKIGRLPWVSCLGIRVG